MYRSESDVANHFVIPDSSASMERRSTQPDNGWLLFVACNAGIDFALDVKARYESFLAEKGSAIKEIPYIGTNSAPITRVFPDKETCARLPIHVAGSHACIFQCTHSFRSSTSVNEAAFELLQVIRTLRVHRARTITVILPYFPYSRQDKPTFMKRESAFARLFIDLLRTAGADGVITYHPHSLALHGFFEPEIQFVPLTGLWLFTRIFAHLAGDKEVIAIAPDAGSAKFTIHFAQEVGIPYAIGNKLRQAGDETSFLGITGDLRNKRKAIIVDDETVTGGSVLSLVKNLYEEQGIKETYMAISHFKAEKKHLAGFAETHSRYGLRELHITDSIPLCRDIEEYKFIKVHSLAEVFSMAINRLHNDLSLSEAFAMKIREP